MVLCGGFFSPRTTDKQDHVDFKCHWVFLAPVFLFGREEAEQETFSRLQQQNRNWQKAQCLDCETCLPEENSGAIQSIFCPKQMLKTQGNTTDQKKKKLTTEKPE